MAFFINGCLDLFIARHGESAANRLGIMQGRSDWPLTDQGREEACKLGRYLKSNIRSFDAVYSSPLIRALDTATEVSKHFPNLNPASWRSLQEIDVGILTGKNLKIALSKDPQLAQALREGLSLHEAGDLTAESFPQAHSRAKRVLKRIIRLHSNGGSILVVSHQGFILHLTKALLGIPPKRRVFFPKANTSVSHFKLEGPVVRICKLASVEHLYK